MSFLFRALYPTLRRGRVPSAPDAVASESDGGWGGRRTGQTKTNATDNEGLEGAAHCRRTAMPIVWRGQAQRQTGQLADCEHVTQEGLTGGGGQQNEPWSSWPPGVSCSVCHRNGASFITSQCWASGLSHRCNLDRTGSAMSRMTSHVPGHSFRLQEGAGACGRRRTPWRGWE